MPLVINVPSFAWNVTVVIDASLFDRNESQSTLYATNLFPSYATNLFLSYYPDLFLSNTTNLSPSLEAPSFAGIVCRVICDRRVSRKHVRHDRPTRLPRSLTLNPDAGMFLGINIPSRPAPTPRLKIPQSQRGKSQLRQRAQDVHHPQMLPVLSISMMMTSFLYAATTMPSSSPSARTTLWNADGKENMSCDDTCPPSRTATAFLAFGDRIGRHGPDGRQRPASARFWRRFSHNE